MPEQSNKVEIHIDGRKYEVLPVTTGAALYLEGQVKSDYDLFREVKGPGDDELIDNSNKPIAVHAGDQFYSAKRTLNPGA